jgi:hypothetical protein
MKNELPCVVIVSLRGGRNVIVSRFINPFFAYRWASEWAGGKGSNVGSVLVIA